MTTHQEHAAQAERLAYTSRDVGTASAVMASLALYHLLDERLGELNQHLEACNERLLDIHGELMATRKMGVVR